jgi:hypothetical protein
MRQTLVLDRFGCFEGYFKSLPARCSACPTPPGERQRGDLPQVTGVCRAAQHRVSC